MFQDGVGSGGAVANAVVAEWWRSKQINILLTKTIIICQRDLSVRAETLGDPYHKQVPLPSIPAYRAQD